MVEDEQGTWCGELEIPLYQVEDLSCIFETPTFSPGPSDVPILTLRRPMRLELPLSVDVGSSPYV